MTYTASPVEYEICDAEQNLIAKVRCFDEAASEVTVTEPVHTPESWRELAQAVEQALTAIHPREADTT